MQQPTGNEHNQLQHWQRLLSGEAGNLSRDLDLVGFSSAFASHCCYL